MDVAINLFDLLTSYSGLSELVANRVYPDIAPENVTAPYLVTARMSNRRVTGHDGDEALGAARYQITGWADSKGDAKNLQQVLLTLNGQEIEVTGGTILFLHIDDREEYDEETRTYSASIEFQLWYG